jgi:hypothetical protein
METCSGSVETNLLPYTCFTARFLPYLFVPKMATPFHVFLLKFCVQFSAFVSVIYTAHLISGEAVTLLICILKVLGLNLGQNSDYVD